MALTTELRSTLAQLRHRAALSRATDHVPHYDGHQPQLGTSVDNAAFETQPPFTNAPGQRSAAAYAAVINQFAVGENPRYRANRRGTGETYCNILVWDVTRAMAAEVPHWVDDDGGAQAPRRGVEQDANCTGRWLSEHGPRHGWTPVTAAAAQCAANEGRPVVFAWEGGNGRGHMGIVRPGAFHPEFGPAIAQAGTWNVNDTHAGRVFESYSMPRYYVHE